ncbi:hypothetical protein HMPREF9306_01200 [Propionimicrobium lymphophilum ACS-093-V-SCH5]|uniref:PD-(D/E)XK endonuclease-like domain-containing protein n=1 Tax=Propionimicrobium lymphophilum ACS-093-V-SCH5 TaxID=883161 RepID=S2WJR2_9ACTN|nr:hypothetical protein HMPREF9306_01200 [Propionimicrobium lymphophilum ACS-093-V-SCH5]
MPDKSVAKGLIGRHGLSPSLFFGLSGCPARWAADRVKQKHSSGSGGANIGFYAHWVLEMFFAGEPHERTEYFFQDCLDAVADRGAERRGLSSFGRFVLRDHIEDACRGIFDIEDPQTVNVVARELRVSGAKIGGAPFCGIVDRLCDRDGLIFVEDYKTSPKIPLFSHEVRSQVQQQLYILALKNLGYEIAGARLLYVRIGRVWKVETSRRSMRDVAARFARAYESLCGWVEDGRFPAVSGKSCHGCRLVEDCPASAHY